MAYNLETAQAQLANLVQSDYTQQDLLDLVRQIDITAEGDLTDLRELTNAFIIANKHNIKFAADTFGPANPTTTSATTRKFAKMLELVTLYARNSIGFSCHPFSARDSNPRQSIAESEQRLVFRSTEFINDAMRGNQASATFAMPPGNG